MELLEAAEKGDVVRVEQLLSAGANVNFTDDEGQTALTLSSRNGHLDVVRFLVEQGAVVEARDNFDVTPLIRAADNGHLAVVRFLVEHGADVNASGSDGQTPLMRAAGDDKLDVVQILVEHGAAVDVYSTDGRTPLMWASRGNKLDMVQFLVEHGAAVDDRDRDDWTPLMWASRGGKLDMVQFLVERGADVNARDSNGSTPLTWASRGDKLDVVQFLVEHGASVDVYSTDGWTPLMWASRGDKLDMVQFLVEHGAAVDASNSDGWTPLMWAAESGKLDVVQILVEHGANVNASISSGLTPLTWASRSGKLDMVQFLVEHGAAVDTSNSIGWTPLMWAAGDDKLDVVQFLVEHGAAVDANSTDGWTPLTLAARDGYLDIVRLLVEHGAAVDASNSDGWTPLMWASRGDKLDVVQFLVEHGAIPNMMTTTGDTALSTAIKFDRQNVVQFLLLLVRHQDRRTQMEHVDEHVTRSSNIPFSWLIAPFEVEVEPFVNARHIGGDYRGKWLDADVVIKLFVDDATSATFVDEVCLWHQLRHPNVLKLYGVCNAGHHLFVCEYASNGSLPEYLKSCNAERRTPWKFLYEAALGLEYLHERKIVHGNLRGSNILIGSDGLAKLSGFTLSASSSEGGWYASGGWVRWAAPESLKGEQISLASDVYSLGMCIIEAVSGKVPYAMVSEGHVKTAVKHNGYNVWDMRGQMAWFSGDQRELVMRMCRTDPRERLQMPTVVNKLERFAEMEATILTQHTAQPEPEALANYDAVDNALWTQVQTLVDKSENALYRQMWHELELIYDALKAESQLWSTLESLHGLLAECRLALDTMTKDNQVRRLSATRARDYSVQGLHRRISQLLQLIRPQEHDTETREAEWKRLCNEQVEVFVSEASEAYVLLSSVDSEEDRSALVAVLRAELRNSDRKYTDKQLEVLQKTYNDIVSKSLEDVQLATTPEWFIPWFELEMSEMTTLGIGGYGSVIKARWLDSEVVVKKLEIDSKDAANDEKKREMRKMFEREVDIWFGLSHPHVVRLFGACHVGRPFFVCELAPNGTLDEYLRRHPDELWVKLREAALGVQYLHARGIVHSDLKCNNILIGSDGKAKVTDFGLSGVLGDDSTDMVLSGAWHWVAPECLLGEKPTFASDIYSLGMCIIKALRVTNGDEDDLPWGNFPNAAVKFNVTRRHLLPPRPQNSSDEAWTLIERMCRSTPTDRMLIMTVVDELEKLAGRHGNLGGETDQIVRDIGKMRLSSSSVTNALAEMKCWIAKCDTKSDWEGSVLKSIYQLLWDRLEQVAVQLFPDGDDTVVTKAAICDLSALVERSKQRTHAALGITGVIPLIKFTELALMGYALHRRLDKYIASHAVLKDSIPLHDWTSACTTFMGVRASLHPACSDDDCSANEETGGGARIASSTEMTAAS